MAYLDYTFGIEIECYMPERANAAQVAEAICGRIGSARCFAEDYNHQVRDHWKIVTDGSLGDYTRGIEVVSPVLRGEAGLAEIAKVMAALDDFGCTVNRSCGLHVHVGVGDATPQFFRDITKLYAYYEPVIDRFLPPSRRGNTNEYCRTLTSVSLAQIDQAAESVGVQNLFNSRYLKLNLQSYRRYKTVEFRQHSGTLDGTKATNWTKLCLRLVDAAKRGAAVETPAESTVAQVNRGRPGSKARLVGDLMLRPEGVSNREATAATGWPTISLPAQAQACGLNFTRRRNYRGEVRYYAAATTVTATPTAGAPSLERLLATVECDAAERAYFRTRTENLSGSVAWAA